MIAFATFDSETLDLLQAAIDGVWQNLPPDRRTTQIKERMAGAAMRSARSGPTGCHDPGCRLLAAIRRV